MTKEYSPFTPGQPVPLEFFVGRLAEINHLKKKVEAAATGRLELAWLSGERGIGKSSLTSFVRYVSDRDANVLGLHVFLGGVSTLSEMVRRVFDRLLKEGNDAGWFPKIRELFGKHIREVGLFGVNLEFEAPGRDLDRLVHDFAPALRNLMSRLSDDKKGLFLALDDINGLASSEDFANWLKSFVDEIATGREPIPLCLCLVGLEEKRQSLVKINPSLGRVFELIHIRPWDENESREFFGSAYRNAGVVVEDEALDLMVDFTGGLPVLAHEIGDAVFKFDSDNVINAEDAYGGISAAADVVGRKYLEPQVFSAIRSERYRKILRKFAATQAFGASFRRRDLLDLLSSDEANVLDNFLKKMKQLGVIAVDPEGGPGAYRFQNLLHHLYFYLDAGPAKESHPARP